MKVKKLHITAIILLCSVFYSLELFSQEPWLYDHEQELPLISEEELIPLNALPPIPVPPIYLSPNAPVLPPAVNNSVHPFFRGPFNQAGFSCGQAAFIGYNYTYEVNRVRNLPANVAANQYPTHFAWNWVNGGNGWYGASYFHTADLMKHVGTPNVVTYGGMSDNGGIWWMTGYDKYYEAMKNRIYDAYAINVGTVEGLNILKHYLHDHLEDSQYGGLANFFANHPSLQTLPPGTPEAGKKVITQWSSFSHALTVVGYNDLICWDYNNDGQYTNHIDINGDGVVDMRDWEIGGLIIVNSYGGVPNWGDGGYAYAMYKTLAEPYGSGGIWNNAVHVLKPKVNSEPQLTMKITLKHDSREKIRVTAGVSLNPSALIPDIEMDFPIINYQGAHRPMQGEYTEAAKTIEFGLDITSLLGYVPSGQNARYFFRVYEKDPLNQGTGNILAYSLMDYTNGVNEIICPNAPTPIFENGITTLWINHTVNYQPVTITTDSLPDAKYYEPYSFQLEADGGSQPYNWFLKMDYEESLSNQTFPYISTEQLTPTSSISGYATKKLDFSFPYFGELYDTVFIHVNGVILFDRQNYPYPYTLEDIIQFKAYRVIAPYNCRLRLYSGQGLWYEGDENSATFRWRASINDNPSSELNFAVKLFPNGNIEYYYGNNEYPTTTEWIGGLSNGDLRAYQYLSFTGSSTIQTNTKVSFTAPDFAPEFSLSTDGVLSGKPTKLYENKQLKFMAVDNNDIFTTKTLNLNTRGLMIDYVVHSGNDSIIEFGETASFDIIIKSLEPLQITDAQLKLSINDPYITLIDSIYQIGAIQSNDSIIIENAFSFYVSKQVPDNHFLNFNILTVSNDDTWSRELILKAYAPVVKPMAVLIQDGNNGMMDPGETTDIAVEFKNLGGALLENINIHLTTNDQNITINQAQASIQSLAPGIGKFATFNISASPNLNIGDIVTLSVQISGHNDYSSTSEIIIITSLLIEDFESGSFVSFPWQFSGNLPWVTVSSGAWEGQHCAKSGDISHNQTSAMILECDVMLTDSISFYRKVSSETNYDFLKFYINGSLKGQWSGTIPWERLAYEVSPGINTFKWEYVKDVSVSNGSDCAWVDYIIFPVMNSCQPPHGLTASNITSNSALLQWNPGGTELLWDLIYGPVGFDPNTQGTLIENINETNLLIQNLTVSTYYSFHVRAYCGSDEYSVWSSVKSFSTLCGTYDLPFTEIFNSASVDCWTYPQGMGNWHIGGSYSPPSSVSGSPNAYFSWDPTVTNYSFSLTSPMLSAVGMINIKMDYLLFLNNYDNNNLEQMSVEYKTSDALSWTLLENFTNLGLGNGNMEYFRTNQALAGVDGKEFQIQFRAHGGSSYSINGWGLDDIFVHGEEDPIIPGDANCDDIVNILDVVVVINFIIGINPQPFCFENADVNNDGIINILDAIEIVNILLGMNNAPVPDLKSQPVSLFLNNEGVDIQSDGTIAGLQFEILGIDPDQISFLFDGFEFAYNYNVENKIFRAAIFSFDNKPIPAGLLRVITFKNNSDELHWGNAMAGNIYAKEVKVILDKKISGSDNNSVPYVSVYPNPSNNDIFIDISVPWSADTKIDLFDLPGRKVLGVFNDNMDQGNRIIKIDKNSIPKPGVYILKLYAISLNDNNEIISKQVKIIINR